MIHRIGSQLRGSIPASTIPAGVRAPAAGFAGVLAERVRDGKNVKFSAHATQRLADRRITLTPGDEASISRAVDKAAAKGARETLLLMDKLALVVSVPNRTIITALSQHELGDTVFTNIDSAVLIAPEMKKPGDV